MNLPNPTTSPVTPEYSVGATQRSWLNPTEVICESSLRLCRIVANMGSVQSSPPRRILAIDDDPVSLALAGLLLQAEGCEVVEAQSGQQALERIAGGAMPDCIVADLRMPSLAGPELARSLRQAAPSALLLAMSATPPLAVEGYDGVLKKPLSPEALRQAFALMPAGLAAQPDAVKKNGSPEGSDTAGVLDPVVFGNLLKAMPLNSLAEVVVTFLADTRMRIGLMRTADLEEMRRQAHTIKGGAGMVGAIEVSAAASTIEAGIDQSDDRRQKLDELERCLLRAEVILKGRLKI